MGTGGAGSVAPAAASADAGSPLIAQYLALKADYPEALLLSRVGDFYEAYGDDAHDLARSLHIILTSKEAGKGKRVAMAGVPHHSVDGYLARLMGQRRVVAIAEQMEQPVPNRLVRREIVRVLTPGTLVEEQFLAPERNNYVCALARVGALTAIACADVSTGTASLHVTRDADALVAQLDSIDPAEVVVAGDADERAAREVLAKDCRVAVHQPAADGHEERARREAAERQLRDLGVALEERAALAAAIALLSSYLRHLKLDADAVLARARFHPVQSAMLLDPATRRHLDLIAGSGNDAKASLLGVLSRTRTAMGGRLLAARLCAPIVDATEIRRRLDRVEVLMERAAVRVALQESLGGIADIERIVQKVRARRAGPRDASALRRSLDAAVAVRAALMDLRAEWFGGVAAALAPEDGALETLRNDLAVTLVDDPPATMVEGGAIRPEHAAELAGVVELRTRSRERLLELETATRARSGLKSLKVKYTQAYGYYFEVPRSQTIAIPDDFARRQSLVNAERFTNVELKELESALLGARARQIAIERELFEALLGRIDAAGEALLACAAALAELDVYCSLAHVAGERGYARPDVVHESIIDVSAGRHPIVEAFGNVDFVANDCRVAAQPRFLLITGPNMGGKSTYLRQTALLSIMAQMGSFVPAKRATLGIVDRLFTRIGAGDDIAAGKSTFYVEMAEMALILRRCTSRSLLLIDEVGRGTGTTDGLAIAQAISEFLLGLGDAMPMVLFATHFHELVSLGGSFAGVENLHVVVAEESHGPVFSHRVLHGASSRSYGIAVAQMAGLPDDVVRRAREIADELESRPSPKAGPLVRKRPDRHADEQLPLIP